MKTIVAIAAVILFYSCTGPNELEAEMISAQLIKIDTTFRYAKTPEQMLTWRDDNHVDYVTYAPLNNNFLLGSKMIVLVKR